MAPPDPGPGLSSAEARLRQTRFGPNDIEDRERHGLLHTLGQIGEGFIFRVVIRHLRGHRHGGRAQAGSGPRPESPQQLMAEGG